VKEFDPECWRRLAPYLARARTKPSWDVEERAPKLVIASRFRQALNSVADSGLSSVIERLEPATLKRYALMRPDDLRWLKTWAAEDPGSLVAALAAFTPRNADAGARFEAWAASDRCTLDPAAALAVGSLFNFAVAPRRVPLMSHGIPPLQLDKAKPRGEEMFDWLESALGWEHEGDRTLAARYRGHLRFAELVHRRLLDEGVPVTDMLDVQSLIYIAALEREVWTSDPPDLRAKERPAPETYLAVCAVYRDEAPYLAEWIEFHRAVGVERFFLYDNGSSDAADQVLAPYVRGGTVVPHEWPGPPLQREIYDHCLTTHGNEARWIAFIDVDEFLFSPELRPLPDLLHEYEQYPAVGVNWAAFGTSGHRTRPTGLVIESYLRRGPLDRTYVGRSVKAILQPHATVRCISAHRFVYTHGLAVDENGFAIQRGATKSISCERLRINHYYTRSEEDLRRKAVLRGELEDAGTRGWLAGPWKRALVEFNEEHDDLITAYVDEVRGAVDRTSVR
jgi:hypothetical protein